MEENIWELRKSFEALKLDDEKRAILSESEPIEKSDQPLGEPVQQIKEIREDSTDPAADLKANLDLSLGDELDSLDVSNESEHRLTFDDSIDQPKYSPKLSIEDNLDRIAVPIHNKRTSIISQRSCISADLVNFSNANVDRKQSVGAATSVSSQQAASKPPSHKEESEMALLDPSASTSVISCHNVSYEVKVPAANSRCGCGRKDKKFILKDISCLFRPGLNAIMGPTGSGKSSLLDVLATRKSPHGLSGHVLVNGSRQPHNFKCMVGYVIQDDIVTGMLTVRENIHFSASLRLPATTKQAEKDERVEQVINDLGLAKCADTRVGTELRRGISGGERKRTNIGMELITSPSVLFLDEPTTGLDSSTAQSVIQLLQRLSRRGGGTTVIFSIHQPRFSIFKQLDRLLLLSNGESIYHGMADQAVDFFTQYGYTCEEHNNPADFLLDVITGGILPYYPPENNAHKQNGVATAANSSETETLIEIEEAAEVSAGRQRELVQNFHKSEWNTQLVSELKPIYLEYEKTELNTTLVRPRVSYPTPPCTQLSVVCRRSFQNMYRNPHSLATQTLSAVLLGLIVGTIYFQVDDSFTSGVQNRVGAFFFIVMNYVFSNMAAVDIFIKERMLFIHENVSGYYRLSSYFSAKLLCDVIPLRGLPILVFTAITYWMIGLSSNVIQFLLFVVTTLLTSLAGTSVALVFSATVSTHAAGTVLTSLVWVIMMVFSGLLVNVETIAPALQWIKYLSIFRYSMNAFTINELKGMEFCDNTGENQTAICDTGDAYMSRQGIAHHTAWDFWHNEVALFLIALAFLSLTYIQLRRIPKHR